MTTQTEYAIGERRHTSAGNIMELVAITPDGRFRVRRVGIVGQDHPQLWDADVVYTWLEWHWESIPLIGQESDTPHFGKFLAR